MRAIWGMFDSSWSLQADKRMSVVNDNSAMFRSSMSSKCLSNLLNYYIACFDLFLTDNREINFKKTLLLNFFAYLCTPFTGKLLRYWKTHLNKKEILLKFCGCKKGFYLRTPLQKRG